MVRRSERSDDQGVYIISVAAEIAGVHPQTLRIYERKGLLNPSRTAGNTRRYSERDIDRLRAIQRLTQEHGINLAGVKMIVELENELNRLRERMEQMSRELQMTRRRLREPDRSQRAIGQMIRVRDVVRFPWERDVSGARLR
jgi:MerR family transcriptional regulator/heat shock protein HspR